MNLLLRHTFNIYPRLRGRLSSCFNDLAINIMRRNPSVQLYLCACHRFASNKPMHNQMNIDNSTIVQHDFDPTCSKCLQFEEKSKRNSLVRKVIKEKRTFSKHFEIRRGHHRITKMHNNNNNFINLDSLSNDYFAIISANVNRNRTFNRLIAADDSSEKNVIMQVSAVNYIHQLLSYYASLSKARLTGLVVLTSCAGYIMSPDAFLLSTFASSTIGTGLMAAGANTFNQLVEKPFDSQMKRTQCRVLVTEKLSSLHAFTFACSTSLVGFSCLLIGCNAITASLGLLNTVLYAAVYTPMKRVTHFNTWIGSVVGALPPLIGWTACSGTFEAGALVLACILFAWQFPHFNSLSWSLRDDYSRAGYQMMSVTNPRLCGLTSLRYSAWLILLCSVASPMSGLTGWWFALDSIPLNAYLLFLSWRFYQQKDAQSARKLFRYSLLYLPLIMVLMVIDKLTLKSKPKQSAVVL